MTGFIVRVQRNGREYWADIDELTDDELDQVEIPSADLGGWIVALAKWIRDHLNERPPRAKPALRLLSIAEARDDRDGPRVGS